MWEPGGGKMRGILYWVVVLLITFMEGANADPCRTVNMTVRVRAGRSCYFVLGQSLTWTRSRRECEAHGSHLAAVNTSTAMDAVRALVELEKVEAVWLGGVEQFTGFMWEDGSKLAGTLADYPWANNKDLATGAGTRVNCVYMDSHSAAWQAGPCVGVRGHICQFDTINRNCSTSATTDVLTLGSVCYMVVYDDMSWFVARGQCRLLGGHMTKLEDRTVNDRLVSQLKGAPLYKSQELWTGLRKSRWLWVTGMEMVTTFWEQREPAGSAICLTAHKYSADAILWKTEYCSTPLQFICQRDDLVALVVPSDSPAAPGRGGGLQNGLLSLLFLLVIVLFIIILFVFCYYRRGKALRKQAREYAKRHEDAQRQNNQSLDAASDEYHPNFTIFTTSDQRSALPSNGHHLTNGDPSVIRNQIKLNGNHIPTPEKDAPIQNNNVPKSKLERNSSLNNTKRIPSQKENKYQNAINHTYDFGTEGARVQPSDKGSDSDTIFKDIANFDPPASVHREIETNESENFYSEIAGNDGLLSKRDMSVYKSAELFAVRDYMKLQIPTAQGESLVMESFQADDENTNNSQDHEWNVQTDRTKYIEDVAKAFDFLVTGEDVSQKGPEVKPLPIPLSEEASKGERALLKKRTRKDSIRSADKSSNESDQVDPADVARAQRRLYGEKERAGSRRKKSVQGHVNGGYSGTDGEMDDERRRHKHRQRAAKEGATNVGTDSEIDDDKKRSHRHKHHWHKYTEEELKEKHRRRKEREKQNGNDKEKVDQTEDEELGLTRVGSPSPLGRLSPLGPLAPLVPEEAPKKKRKHRKHKKDMTPEEYEEAKRRHKRRKEKCRRQKEWEASAQKVESNHIHVQGKPQDTEDDSDKSDDSCESTEDTGRSGSVIGTPKKSSGSGGRQKDHARRPSTQGSLVYDIENSGAGAGIEV